MCWIRLKNGILRHGHLGNADDEEFSPFPSPMLPYATLSQDHRGQRTPKKKPTVARKIAASRQPEEQAW